MRNIYVASSWRNRYQPEVVRCLRGEGHLVYDFRNPPNKSGFGWEQINANWTRWSFEEYQAALRHPLATSGFHADHMALEEADTCVLVMPSGRSAHLEAGYMIGQDKPTLVYMPEMSEPELMYLLADRVVNNIFQVVDWVNDLDGRPRVVA